MLVTVRRCFLPFVKLDCGILTSTIWDDYDARMIFLTALLMAEPREFQEPVPQIHVRKLENTGWSAPPGWYGFVPAAGSGIVRRAGGMSIEDGLNALERLGAPEQESRSQEHDGRRLIRVNGGFLVLNYEKYRERDYTAAERTRRWRERNRVTRNGDADTRNVTQAEAEGREQKTEEEHGEIKPPQRASRARRQTRADVIAAVEAFDPDEPLRMWAAQNAPTVPIDRATERWKDRLRENGYRTKQGPIENPAASWRKHISNDEEWGTYTKRGGNGNGNGRSETHRSERKADEAPRESVITRFGGKFIDLREQK